MIIRQEVRTLKTLLKGDGWNLDQYTLCNPSIEIELWVANGFLFLKVYEPFKHDFSFFEQLYLWPTVKRVMRQCRNKQTQNSQLLNYLNQRMLER